MCTGLRSLLGSDWQYASWLYDEVHHHKTVLPTTLGLLSLVGRLALLLHSSPLLSAIGPSRASFSFVARTIGQSEALFHACDFS